MTAAIKRSGSVNKNGERGRLSFLCGLPQSGKSRYSTLFAQETGPRPRVIISGDDFRLALTGQEYSPRAEAMVFSVMDTAILALLDRGYDVLVDETSTSRATLMRYLRLDPDAEMIFIDTPAEECKRRALENERPYLVRVIDRLAPRLDKFRQGWESLRQELLVQIEHRIGG